MIERRVVASNEIATRPSASVRYDTFVRRGFFERSGTAFPADADGSARLVPPPNPALAAA